MEYGKIFSNVYQIIKDELSEGSVPDYIPELTRVNPDSFGVHLTTVGSEHFSFQDSEVRFSIQSISKVLALTMAYEMEGESLWKRVGVEPSGTPFNSMIQLEYESGIPRNPLINAGALVICDILVSRLHNTKVEFLEFLRKISGIHDIHYDADITQSEKSTGFRNMALIHLMKSYGNIFNDVEEVADLYFHMCSIKMNCRELASSFLFLANYGVNPYNGERIINISKSKRINAIMQLCGFYDEAGEFGFRVGLPGKSGVGGGIVAVYPGKYSIATWSPRLNRKGNSHMGIHFLEKFTTETQTSIF